MNVRNCLRCGKIFRPLAGKRVCPNCIKEDQKEFDSVREYLRRNPKASVMEVTQETGVTVKKIQEYVRDGRLVTSTEELGVKCEKCRVPISRGRFCPECSAKFGQALRGNRPAGFGRRDPRGSSGGTVIRDRFRRR